MLIVHGRTHTVTRLRKEYRIAREILPPVMFFIIDHGHRWIIIYLKRGGRMAKINSGILGPLSGKVSGVVGGSWRGVPYIRGYAKPGYSNTDAQALQRAKMAYAVEAAKPFVGRVFNPYYDKFLSKRSGFNQFISNNIQGAGELADVTSVIVTDGSLYPGSGVWTTGFATYTIPVLWNEELGVDGSLTDVAVAWVRDPISNRVFFSANGTRGDGDPAGLSIVTDAAFSVLASVELGVFFAKMNTAGDVVQKISRNLSSYVTF
jgi:hypothetical protein